MNHTKQGRRASRLKGAAWQRYCAEFRGVPKTSDPCKCPAGGCDYCRWPPFRAWRVGPSRAPRLSVKATQMVGAIASGSSGVAAYLRAIM